MVVKKVSYSKISIRNALHYEDTCQLHAASTNLLKPKAAFLQKLLSKFSDKINIIFFYWTYFSSPWNWNIVCTLYESLSQSVWSALFCNNSNMCDFFLGRPEKVCTCFSQLLQAYGPSFVQMLKLLLSDFQKQDGVLCTKMFNCF